MPSFFPILHAPCPPTDTLFTELVELVGIMLKIERTDEGRTVEEGSVEQIFSNPQQEQTKQFISQIL